MKNVTKSQHVGREEFHRQEERVGISEMSTSCHGLITAYVDCLRQTECYKVRFMTGSNSVPGLLADITA